MSAYIKLHMKLCLLLFICFFASMYFVYTRNLNIGIPFVILIANIFSAAHYFAIHCYSCGEEYGDIFSDSESNLIFLSHFFWFGDLKAVNNCYECDAKLHYKFYLFPYLVFLLINIGVAIIGYIVIDSFNINTFKIYRFFDLDFHFSLLSIFIPVPLLIAKLFLLKRSIVTLRSS